LGDFPKPPRASHDKLLTGFVQAFRTPNDLCHNVVEEADPSLSILLGLFVKFSFFCQFFELPFLGYP